MKAKRDEAKAGLWAERIAAFERSTLSRRAWCRQEGLNPNTLDYWRSRLRPTPSALVPIVVAQDGAREAAPSSTPWIELMACGGVRVTVRDADAAWLAGLLRALAC